MSHAGDKYHNFAELAANEVEGVDYRIVVADRGSKMLCMAIHGGGIEPGTSEIAQEVAGGEYNLYLFEGLKSSGNSDLHITSTNFDEPQALDLVGRSTFCLSFHGYSGAEEICYIGGLDQTFIQVVTKHLTQAGFNVQTAPPDIEGTDPQNIANKTIRRAGVQLELTRGLRDSFFVGGAVPKENRQNKTSRFYEFTNAMKAAATEMMALMVTKKLGFENLLPYSSLGKDSNDDGVVDGWQKRVYSEATTSWLFDEVEQAQVINVTSVTAQSFPGIETIDFIPVQPNTEYTFSAYLKGEGNLIGGTFGTGPRIEIAWYDASQVFITNNTSAVVTNTDYTRVTMTRTSPANAAYAKCRITFRCNDATAYGTLWAKWAQFERGQNLLINPAMNVNTDENDVADGWTKQTEATATSVFSVDTTEGAQKIEVTSSTDQSLNTQVRQTVNVVPGKTYSFSMDVKAANVTGTNTGPRIKIEWWDASNNFISNVVSSVYTGSTWTRLKLENVTAPPNAATARVCGNVRINAAGDTATAWFRNAKFEEGPTATDFGVSNPRDYEETDFFTIVNPAADANNAYAYGWEKTNVKKESGVYGYRSITSGPSTYPTFALKFSTPENAGTVTLRFWADTTELPSGDYFAVWDGGELVLNVPRGQAQAYTVTLRRGNIFLTFQHQRGASTTGNVYIDGIEISWDEVSANPAPTPPTAKKVYVIDFESETYDPFFTVKEKADGYTYGFKRRYDYRNSGFYSFGVEDLDVTAGYPDDFSPPTIPKGATAACSFKFKIPITAINPILRMYAYFDAENGYEKARILINGDEVWSTMTRDGWVQLDFALVPGTEYTVIVEYIRDPNSPDTVGTDSVYIDDVTVAYDIPDKPLMYVASAPVTEIKTTTNNFSIQETFETSTINKFFTVNNPSKLKSGGGKSQYPEAGWWYTNKIAYGGFRSFRAYIPDHGEDAAVDFTFRVPYGVRNARAEWWNFVELERSKHVPSGAKYNRLYDEYRIWVNYSLWKNFHYCSPGLTQSVRYTGPESLGDPANDYACPWGRWWKETLPLTPGRTYTLTFELQRNSTDSSSNIFGRNLCVIDNLTVSWTETPGDVVVTPPQPLVFFDGRDGYSHLYDRAGAEMAPLSFAEYKVYGSPGSVHQFTQIEPRDVEFPVLIEGTDWTDTRQKIRNLTSQLANKPLVLVVAQPDGETRQLNCRFAELMGREKPDEHFTAWKKAVLSFRAFDPFWYGDWVVIDGATHPDANNETWVRVNNTGDAEAWPIIKIYGPVTDPRVQLTLPDDDFEVFAEFKLTGFTIPSGRYVVVDTRPGRKTVILDDGQNLYQYLDASINELFSIPQGEWGVDLDGSGTDANTKITVEFQPPYWGV